MKDIGGREACKNPIASFPFSCYSHPCFIKFQMSLGALLNSGINKHLSALPGKLSFWNNARCYIHRTICHTTFGLQFTGVSLPSPSVKQSMEQTSHLLFYSPVLLTWAVSHNAILFAIKITDCALLPAGQRRRAVQVISLTGDMLGLSTHACAFLWLHSLGSAIVMSHIHIYMTILDQFTSLQ